MDNLVTCDCGCVLPAREEQAGKHVTCPDCGKEMTIPERGSELGSTLPLESQPRPPRRAASPPMPVLQLREHDSIGPYTLIRMLGHGRFGVVWLAERRGSLATTQMAVKLPLDPAPDLERMALEARLWVQAGGHANILPVHEAEVYDGQMVIVTEYAPDGSLEVRLKAKGGLLPTKEAVGMGLGILAGLEHLHQRGIVHRDLKPANILLQGPTPRLTDFGLARVLKTSSQSMLGPAGSPPYMAPEAWRGGRSVSSDLWSAGVILFEMLTGHRPFPQNDLIELMGAIIQREPEPLPETVPSVLREVIERALQKDPQQRFATAAEMREALRAYYWPAVTGARPGAAPELHT